MGYSKEYSNNPVQMQIQEPLKETIEHHSHNKIKETVNLLGDTFGWVWLLGIIIVGAIVVASVIFKEHIKKIAGTFIRWLDLWINKE